MHYAGATRLLAMPSTAQIVASTRTSMQLWKILAVRPGFSARLLLYLWLYPGLESVGLAVVTAIVQYPTWF